MPLVSLQWLLRELVEKNSPAKFSGMYHTHPLFILSIMQDQVWMIKPQKYIQYMWMPDTVVIFLEPFYLKTRCPVCL